MTQYINRFESVSGATGASGLLSPNVTTVASGDTSVLLMLDCGDNKEVEIKEQGGVLVMQEKSSGPEMVDLGLSVKWAKCNLGAENEQDYGNFYAWGETTGYTGITATKFFTWADYEHVTNWINEKTGFNRYPQLDEQVSQVFGMPVKVWADTNSAIVATVTESPNIGDLCVYSSDMESVTFGKVSQVSGTVIAFKEPDTTTLRSDIHDSNNILLPQYDVVTATLGSNYRMPTKAELQELLDGTTQTIETVGEVSGTRFTSKTNSNSIFVPFAGDCYDGSRNGAGSCSELWSSSVNEDDSYFAWDLSCYSGGNRYVGDYYRYNGLSVRAVSQNSI